MRHGGVTPTRTRPMTVLHPAPRHPHFITLEGGEGAGKTTAIGAVVRALRACGHEVLQTREPGGTPIAEAIRDLVLTPAVESMTPAAELMLMFAARAQHVETVIRPALDRGDYVVSDRFVDSSYAYQGYARDGDLSLISTLDRAVVTVMPSLTLFLDLPVEVGRRRMASRGGEADRIEKEQLEFFERARQGFLQRAASDPDRFRIIDASAPLDMVVAHLERAVLEHVASTAFAA